MKILKKLSMGIALCAGLVIAISGSTVTAEFGGVFKDKEKKREFLDYIKLETEF